MYEINGKKGKVFWVFVILGFGRIKFKFCFENIKEERNRFDSGNYIVYIYDVM